MDCRISYVEGSLILEHEDQKEFLTTIDEYVPVHSYSPSRRENRTIPAKKLTEKAINVEIAVIALNEKGTRVAAIYMVEIQEKIDIRRGLYINEGFQKQDKAEASGMIVESMPTL